MLTFETVVNKPVKGFNKMVSNVRPEWLSKLLVILVGYSLIGTLAVTAFVMFVFYKFMWEFGVALIKLVLTVMTLGLITWGVKKAID